MSGLQRFLACITGMMSDAYTTVTSFGEKFSRVICRTSYSVPELRHVRFHKVGDIIYRHVPVERYKLNLPEESKATWLNQASLAALVAARDNFLNTLRLVCNTVAENPSRKDMNKRLGLIRPALFCEPADLALWMAGDRDCCDAFLAHVDNCVQLFTSLYGIEFFKQQKQHPLMQPAISYRVTSDERVSIEWALKLLSHPAFVTVCNDFLQLAAAQTGIQLPAAFVDQVVLDLQAMLCNMPIPSFVVSEVFHEQIRQLFPAPARADFVQTLPLPGSFPQDVEDEEPARQESQAASPPAYGAHMAPPQAEPTGAQDEYPPCQPEPPSPVIARTDTSRTAHVRTDYLAEFISEITPQEFHAEFYHESDAHRAIKATYVTDFEPKEPPKPLDVGKPKSILRNRPKHESQHTPKRLRMARAPRNVRFTEGTLSPQPRTHVGMDVPRRIDGDDESDDKSMSNYIRIGLQVPTSTSRNLFSRDEGVRARATLSWLRQSNQRSMTAGRKSKSGRNVPSARIQELINSPIKSGLAEMRPDRIAGLLVDIDVIDSRVKAAEEARKAQEEAQRAAEEARRRELEESLARTDGLRQPLSPLVSPVSDKWWAQAQGTLTSAPTKTHGRTPEGTELRRHDFASLIPRREWLNDEIINGSLLWLDRAVNEVAGIKDARKQTRRCLAMSSFFFKDILDKGPTRTERKLLRCGVTKDNFLGVETMLLPICDKSHWTLLVVRPKHGTVAHMDSLEPRGGSQRYTALALEWIKDVLQDKFEASEWKVVRHEAPEQKNGYDCGVFTITNAMCLALSLSPVDSYSAEDMAMQRVRIACMLLNSGFKGDFDLGGY